ncbi:MAG: aldolase/citrate lyase family protein [Pseudomonadota bacterium]|nr:aldolase/citrate lyase family protein [Pseudomonadota bacterium]
MTLKHRLAARDLVIGSFVKTPHPAVVELLGQSALDCLVLDAEHAPFDRSQLDMCILAARATGMPVLVRPQAATAERILDALDLGADGVILPHIRTARCAEDAVRHCFYGPGGRGFAGSTRAAGYTSKGMAKTRADGAGVVVIAQIEDIEALDEIEAIASIEGIDALFIGRADLTVALGAESPDDAIVIDAVRKICRAAAAANRPVGMFLARPSDVPRWQEEGASLFLLSSDQEFLLKGAAALCAEVKP